MNESQIILIDSDAFVSSVKQNDANHKKVESIFRKLERKDISFITSNYVFAETVTVISQKISHEVAVDFINSMKSESSIFVVKWINEELEEIAINIFRGQKSKNTSFVDCTNLALMRYYHLEAIFSFDEVYKKNGFKLVS